MRILPWQNLIKNKLETITMIDKRTRRDFNKLVRQLKKPFTKDISFPLQMINGRYPIEINENNKIRCPHCGHIDFSLFSYTHIECNTCFSEFINLGVLGLEPIK